MNPEPVDTGFLNDDDRKIPPGSRSRLPVEIRIQRQDPCDIAARNRRRHEGWERWDAIKPGEIIRGGELAAEDGASMTSFNHYAYGAVGPGSIARWLAEPRYRVIAFAPQPGGGLDWAEARIDTPYGRSAIRWEQRADDLAVRIEVPPGAAGKFASPPGVGRGAQRTYLGNPRVFTPVRRHSATCARKMI